LLAEGYPTFWKVVKSVSSRVQQSEKNVILLGLLGTEEEDTVTLQKCQKPQTQSNIITSQKTWTVSDRSDWTYYWGMFLKLFMCHHYYIIMKYALCNWPNWMQWLQS